MIISIHFIEFLFLITCWLLCLALYFSNATARSVVEHMKNSISCFRSSVSWTRSLALRDRRQFRTKNQQTGHFPCSGSQSKGIICVYFHHRSEFPVLFYRLNINIILQYVIIMIIWNRMLLPISVVRKNYDSAYSISKY